MAGSGDPVQQVGASVPEGSASAGAQRTFLPLYIKPGTPPFLKQHKRHEYLEEYVGFEKDRYRNTLKAVFCFVFGVLTLQAFTPGALLMIAMAARYQDLAWWATFIAKTYGRYRSLILVD